MTRSDFLTRATLYGYKRIGQLIYPFMGPFLAFRARNGKEDRTRRYERYGYPSSERPQGPLVWFHAASVGESLAVLALIARVHELGMNAVMTTGTVTSAKVVAKRLPEGTFHQYVPLDLEAAVDRFLNHWQPDLAVFTESEIWPTTMDRLRKRRISHVLVNARMSDKSFARWKNARGLANNLFEGFSHVIAQSKLDAERYRVLGAKPVVVSGNLKVETQKLPYDEQALSHVKNQITDRPSFIAASTHRGEEEVILNSYRELKKDHPDLLLILVPRHPERGDEVEALVRSQGFDVARRSRKEAIRPVTNIYLGDTIGEMGLYYRLSDIVYVGRSLAGFGGQNPLEPATIGAAVLSGKHVSNFRDSYSRLLKNKAVRLVGDGQMLTANLAFLLDNPSERERMIIAAKKSVDELAGALDRTVEVLESYVFPLIVKRKLEEMRNGR